MHPFSGHAGRLNISQLRNMVRTSSLNASASLSRARFVPAVVRSMGLVIMEK